MKLLSFLLIAFAAFEASAHTTRVISDRTYDVSLNITRAKLSCTSDIQVVDSILLFPELLNFVILDTPNVLMYRDSYVDCPDFNAYLKIVKRLGNPIKGKLRVMLTEVRGLDGHSGGRCAGVLSEEVTLTLTHELDLIAPWSSFTQKLIAEPSVEECSNS